MSGMCDSRWVGSPLFVWNGKNKLKFLLFRPNYGHFTIEILSQHFFVWTWCDLFSSRLRSGMLAKWQKLLTQQTAGTLLSHLCWAYAFAALNLYSTLPCQLISSLFFTEALRFTAWTIERSEKKCLLQFTSCWAFSFSISSSHYMSGWQLFSTFVNSRRTRATDKIQLLYCIYFICCTSLMKEGRKRRKGNLANDWHCYGLMDCKSFYNDRM